MRRLLFALAVLLWGGGVSSGATLLPMLAGSGGSPPLSCAEATTFLARNGNAHAVPTTALICGLVADGIWTKLDFLYLLATDTTGHAALNLISTSYTLTTSAAPTFTADQGYAGNGSTQFLRTNFNPTTATTPNYVQDSASIFGWALTASGGVNAQWGFYAASVATAIATPAGTSLFSQVNKSSGGGSITVSGDIGFFMGSRYSSTLTAIYDNGTYVGDVSGSSTGVPNSDLFICSIAASGVGNFTIAQVGAVGGGSAITGTDADNLYARLHVYMQTVAGVP